MACIRKTRDIWEVQCNYGYGHGWETECTEFTLSEARQRIKEYRSNSPYPVRLRMKREPIL